MQRYFAINKYLELNEDDRYHLLKVMRMKPNDMIEIIFDSQTYLCRIEHINNYDVKISVVEEIKEIKKIDYEVSIAIGLLKESKLDLVIQKATELGVNKIYPIVMERSIIKLTKDKEPKKKERWLKIAKEASEQSGRINMPIINDIKEVKDLINLDYDLKIVCIPDEKALKIKEVLSKCKKCDRILIVIGPEGGLTKSEEKILTDNKFFKVTLGNLILRTETAPIYALSVVNYEFMR